MDNISVVRIDAGEDDGAEIIFKFNSKRIAVSIFASQPSNECQQPIENHLIKLLSQATSIDFDEQ